MMTMVLPRSRSWCSTPEQLLDIVEVQPRWSAHPEYRGSGRCPAWRAPRQLDPLRLAARERGGGLTERMWEAHVHQGLQLARHRRYRIEEGTGIFHRHLEDFVDVLALYFTSRVSRL